MAFLDSDGQATKRAARAKALLAKIIAKCELFIPEAVDSILIPPVPASQESWERRSQTPSRRPMPKMDVKVTCHTTCVLLS